MGEPGEADDDLQLTILYCVVGLSRDHVLSTNKAIEHIRHTLPGCALSAHELAKLIGTTARSLDVIPVFDPQRATDATGSSYDRDAPGEVQARRRDSQ